MWIYKADTGLIVADSDVFNRFAEVCRASWRLMAKAIAGNFLIR
jgi:hypothetical protein